MSVITFDALTYIDELVEVGVPEAQAKKQIKILQSVIDETLKNELATKVDVIKLDKRLVRVEIIVGAILVVGSAGFGYMVSLLNTIITKLG